MKNQFGVLEFILLLILVGLVGFGYYSVKNKKSKLAACSEQVSAIILDKYRVPSKGYFIKYKYIVNGKSFESTDGIDTKEEIEQFNEGDTIVIIYSCEDPAASKYRNLDR